jgi:mRNA m6A methyltransferase catalytic subunit
VEAELKQNIGKQNVSASEFNDKLALLKEKSHI